MRKQYSLIIIISTNFLDCFKRNTEDEKDVDLISAEELQYIQDSWTTSSYLLVEPTNLVYGENYLDIKASFNFYTALNIIRIN